MSIATASATATFTADEIIVETALGGTQYRLSSFNKTINLGVVGAGGMDVAVSAGVREGENKSPNAKKRLCK